MKRRPFVPNRRGIDIALNDFFIGEKADQQDNGLPPQFTPVNLNSEAQFLASLGLESGYKLVIDDDGNIIVAAEHLSRQEVIENFNRLRERAPSITESREFEVIQNPDGYCEKIIPTEEKKK